MNEPFYDPMCGTGTLLVEAIMISRNIPPRSQWNSFAFMKWEDYDARIWNRVLAEAKDAQLQSTTQIYGSDKDRKAIWLAEKTIKDIGIEEVPLTISDFFMKESTQVYIELF